MLRSFFERRHTEIDRDPALRWYAWALVAAHAVTWLYLRSTGLVRSLLRSVEPLCWPFFEDCWKFRLESDAAVATVLVTYGGLILLSGALLTYRRVGAFWASLLATAVILAAMVSLDYRFRANQFYMLLWLTVVYLLWPARRWAVSLVIVSFYFWAGVLKLNVEWLSGAALYGELWFVPASLVWLACWYVVTLELFLVWGLLAGVRWLTMATLGQLALFHLESLSQIHWYYPVLMATVLSWFVLDRIHAAPRQALLGPLVTGRAPKSAYALLLTFAAFQLAPHAYAGDSTLTGQGRVFALHMFEAHHVCDVSALITSPDGRTSVVDLKVHEFPPRLICDPVVYFNRAQNLCRDRAALGIADVDLRMRTRRRTDAALVTIIDEPAFCRGAFTYSVVGNNPWLRLDSR